MKAIKTFNNAQEVIASRKNDNWSSLFATIIESAYPLNNGHYIEVSRKHVTAPFGITYPCTLLFEVN